jgi:hypothetical protein
LKFSSFGGILGTTKILAKLPNAHNTPFFGPIIEWINTNQTHYGALVVQNNPISDLDRWVLALIDLQTQQYKEIELSPIILAKVTSASALGF